METSKLQTPRPEYPNPQFARSDWLNLNGEWEFAFDDENRGRQLGWQYGLPLERRIIVPFPYQSELSGVGDKTIHEVVWYSRSFDVPDGWRGKNLLLHFGAVDYRSTIWINGQEVGHNQGGHVPFEFEIASYLNQEQNRLTVRVVARTVAETTAATAHLQLEIPDAKLWSPDSPTLYDLRLRLFEGEALLDEVQTYAGLRDVELRDGRVWLNGKAIYLAMILDQGYWPESYLAAPSDEHLRAGVEWVKRFGFNGARKHQKIEDPRWLYWCDRLGLLVWEEMPNAREWSSQAEERLAAEWKRAVQRDYNHPCIITWVPVNESMGFPRLGRQHPGQYAFIERMVAMTRQLDPRRPVIDNDGWEHTDIADICAIHDYTPTAELLRQRYSETTGGATLPAHVWIGNKPLFVLGSRYRGQPVMLTEVGGFLLIPQHIRAEERDMLYKFYGSFNNSEELLAKYRDLMEGIASLQFVAGFCYTQLTDIEQEVNGLLTYDRRAKVAPEQIAEIHRRLFDLGG